jgi:AcrR family transcriptional regulator
MERKQNKRKRRTADQARDEILTVAERHLARSGPEGVRLSAIADEMGVTHPALLKHFASREALLGALLRRAGRRLQQTLSGAVAEPGDGELDVTRLFESLDVIYRTQGYARLSAWLVLSGFLPSGSGMFREAGESLHRARGRRRGSVGELEDTLFAVVLANLVAWSDALVGSAFRRAVDLPADAATRDRFRDWFAALLRDQLAR